MPRAGTLVLAVLTVIVALPAAAQEGGGLRPQTGPAAMLEQIDANRGCPLSSTRVAVGVNRAFTPGSSATQQMGTVNGSGGCRPLVSTQVAAGVNLSLGRGSQAAQSIAVQGPRGVLAGNTFTKGVNMAVGARSTATQQILNQTTR